MADTGQEAAFSLLNFYDSLAQTAQMQDKKEQTPHLDEGTVTLIVQNMYLLKS